MHDPTSGALLRELDLAAKTGAIAATQETIWMRADRSWPPWTRLDRGALTPVGDDRYLSLVEVEIPPGLAAPPVVADDRVRPRIWSDEARTTPAPEPLAIDLRRRLDVVADAPVYTFDGPIEPCEGTCPPSPAAYFLVEDGDVQRLVAVDAGGRGAIRGEVRCDHRPTALERARFIRLVHR